MGCTVVARMELKLDQLERCAACTTGYEPFGGDWMGGYPLSQTSTMQSMDAWKPALSPKPG